MILPENAIGLRASLADSMNRYKHHLKPPKAVMEGGSMADGSGEGQHFKGDIVKATDFTLGQLYGGISVIQRYSRGYLRNVREKIRLLHEAQRAGRPKIEAAIFVQRWLRRVQAARKSRELALRIRHEFEEMARQVKQNHEADIAALKAELQALRGATTKKPAVDTIMPKTELETKEAAAAMTVGAQNTAKGSFFGNLFGGKGEEVSVEALKKEHDDHRAALVAAHQLALQTHRDMLERERAAARLQRWFRFLLHEWKAKQFARQMRAQLSAMLASAVANENALEQELAKALGDGVAALSRVKVLEEELNTTKRALAESQDVKEITKKKKKEKKRKKQKHKEQKAAAAAAAQVAAAATTTVNSNDENDVRQRKHAASYSSGFEVDGEEISVDDHIDAIVEQRQVDEAAAEVEKQKIEGGQDNIAAAAKGQDLRHSKGDEADRKARKEDQDQEDRSAQEGVEVDAAVLAERVTARRLSEPPDKAPPPVGVTALIGLQTKVAGYTNDGKPSLSESAVAASPAAATATMMTKTSATEKIPLPAALESKKAPAAPTAALKTTLNTQAVRELSRLETAPSPGGKRVGRRGTNTRGSDDETSSVSSWNSLAAGGRGTPDWKSDSHRGTCSSCEIPFGFLRRQHHCRLCGDLFCDKCSEGKRRLPAYLTANGPQLDPGRTLRRVCNPCGVDFDRGRPLGTGRQREEAAKKRRQATAAKIHESRARVKKLKERRRQSTILKKK